MYVQRIKSRGRQSLMKEDWRTRNHEEGVAMDLSDARAWGDEMQSEASRLVEFVRAGTQELPYEVGMAAAAVESCVERWTELRRAEGGDA